LSCRRNLPDREVSDRRLVARPTGAAPGTLPRVTWRRQIEIDPRVRGFKLQFTEADFT
jgi:hypothetical protein